MRMPNTRSSVGAVLGGRYRLDALVGRGGGADVFTATDLRSARRVTVKVLRDRMDAASFARFTSAVQSYVRVRHASLLPLIDCGTTRDRLFVVTPALTGGTLRQRLAGGPLSPVEVARLGAACADGLAYLHLALIAHRGIEPSIVLVDGDRYVLSEPDVVRDHERPRVTSSGMLVGTAGYLAPEQVRGHDVGPAADIYALGLVLLEALTGRVEYRGDDRETALVRLIRLPRLPVGLPPGWRALLSAMTVTTPAARPSAAECATVLTMFTRRTAVPPPPVTESGAAIWSTHPGLSDRPSPTSDVPVEQDGRAGRVLAAITALACVGVAAVIGLGSYGGQPQEAGASPPARVGGQPPTPPRQGVPAVPPPAEEPPSPTVPETAVDSRMTRAVALTVRVSTPAPTPTSAATADGGEARTSGRRGTSPPAVTGNSQTARPAVGELVRKARKG